MPNSTHNLSLTAVQSLNTIHIVNRSKLILPKSVRKSEHNKLDIERKSAPIEGSHAEALRMLDKIGKEICPDKSAICKGYAVVFMYANAKGDEWRSACLSSLKDASEMQALQSMKELGAHCAHQFGRKPPQGMEKTQ